MPTPGVSSGRPPVMSREFIRRARRVPAPADPDQATAETVRLMCGHIQAAASDPVLKSAASTAIRQYAMGGPLWAVAGLNPYRLSDAAKQQALAEACWWYAKHRITFVHHQKQIEVWFGERHHLQLLISPDVLLRFPFAMEGDCAIFTMMLCAMLTCLGLNWEIVTLAVDPSQPEIFSHVYPRLVLADGSRLALDASHGKFPGWSVPIAHRSRIAVWDADGRQTSDSGEQAFIGLHAYRIRGLGQDNPGVDTSVPVDTSSLFNLGDTSNALNPFALSSMPTSFTPTPAVGPDLSTLWGLPTTAVTTTPGTVPVVGAVAPAQNSAQWANFATGLAKSGMTLAQINAIQPGTVVSPNGSILRQATGYPVVPTDAFGALGAGLTSSSVMMVGGIALIFLLVMMAKK